MVFVTHSSQDNLFSDLPRHSIATTFNFFWRIAFLYFLLNDKISPFRLWPIFEIAVTRWKIFVRLSTFLPSFKRRNTSSRNFCNISFPSKESILFLSAFQNVLFYYQDIKFKSSLIYNMSARYEWHKFVVGGPKNFKLLADICF